MQTQSNRLDELEKMIEMQNRNCPTEIEGGTFTKSYLEGDYYVEVFVINDQRMFSAMKEYKKIVKRNLSKILKSNAESVYMVQLLVDCNKELKCKYISERFGDSIDLIFIKNDLKKLLK